MESEIADGWDDNGIHCWSMHIFSSPSVVENGSIPICKVERSFCDGHVEMFCFRKYLNRKGDERFVMLHEGEREVFITDAPFFRGFCDGMLESGEISSNDHRILVAAISDSATSP